MRIFFKGVDKMALKLVLPDDEYVRILRKMMALNEKTWEILDREDIPWECLEKVYWKYENEHRRYSELFFNSVRQSTLLKELKSSA